MASITKHHGGWLIQFTFNGKRRSLYPGVMPKKQAMQVREKVESIISARKAGTSISDATAVWLSDRETDFLKKLHNLGLIEEPQNASDSPTLSQMIATYFSSRAKVKVSTLKVWGRAQKLLLAFFGKDRLISSITIGDAKDFRQELLRQNKSENTVRKMCSVASQFFNDAIDREIIDRNPFQNKAIPRTSKGVDDRKHFVTREMAAKVLDACPDAEWRLIFALARFGGLRCPSEVMKLEWSHILWDQNRIIVPSPKTEHHEGHAERIMPLFPELRPHLEEMFHRADPGASRIISHHSNHGVKLKRIVLNAGLKPWPKIFHNLRSSRQTELTEEFGIKAACVWLGNSIRVADVSYLQVPDEYFDRAAVCNADCNAEGVRIEMNQAKCIASDKRESLVKKQQTALFTSETIATQWTLQDSNL